eukprot:12268874-Ditylum_brightwellii.AAC.1
MKAIRWIFEEYFAPVQDICLSDFPKSKEDFTACKCFYIQMIWNSMQMLELTKEMMATQIKHYHMVSSAYTEWSLLNSGKSEARKAIDVVSKIGKKVKDLTTLLTTAKRADNDALSLAKGVKTNVDK